MLKTFASYAMLAFVVACSGQSGSSDSAPVPVPVPNIEPQVDTLSYAEGLKCVLFDANGETKEIFITRSETADGVTLTLSDLDGEELSAQGLTLGGLRFRSFSFEKAATLSEKAVVTSAAETPLPLVEGYLQGTIETGFELLTQELIAGRNGNLIPTPTMDMFASIDDCREARAEL
jgi:hypothetical protein